ncbi:MAG: sugar O-acetyltransferase [Lachnospiraceae bacterium]|nr:sugar O-acetyltransferase [Lachnospiraceae bacterium]
MTEEEKIFAGKLFDLTDPELLKIKHETHAACQRYNMLDEYDPERQAIIRRIMGSVGANFRFQGPMQINYGKHMFVGDNFIANFNFTAMDDGPIYIGNNVSIGPNVSLMATNHPLIASERVTHLADGRRVVTEFAPPIRIEDDVWIACNVTVIAGVTIGRGAVIGAGSVVTRDIPANYVAAGAPARPLYEITAEHSMRGLIAEEDREKYAHFFQ